MLMNCLFSDVRCCIIYEIIEKLFPRPSTRIHMTSHVNETEKVSLESEIKIL